MKKIRSFLPLVIGFLILGVVVYLSDIFKIYVVILQTSLLFLVIASISVMVTYLIQTIRFMTLISTFYSTSKFLKTYRIIVTASVANLFFPASGGDIVIRPFLLRRFCKMEYKDTFLVVLLERIMDLVSLLILVLIAVLVLLPKLTLYVLIILLTCLVLIISLLFIPKSILPIKLPYFILKHIRFLRQIKSIPIRIFIYSCLLTVINVLFLIITVSLVIYSLGFIPTFEMVGLFFISAVAGILSFIPGGLGIMDGSIAGLFNLFNLEPSLGVSITIVIRFIIIFVSILFGGSIIFSLKREI